VGSSDLAAAGGTLEGVTAIRPDDVWAVGYRRLPGTPEGAQGEGTLIAHWDGQSWRIVPSPNPGKIVSRLDAVAGTGPQDVWAVGSFAGGTPAVGDSGTLILHWDGQAWTQVPSPNRATWANALFSVSASAPDTAWAVGRSDNGEHSDPLALRWDGTQWRIVPTPPSGSHNGGWFSGVAVLSPQDVWAVGGDNPVPLLTHWDGRQWSPAQLPAGGGRNGLFGSLAAVAGRGPSAVWAVGGDRDGLGSGTRAVQFSDQGCRNP